MPFQGLQKHNRATFSCICLTSEDCSSSFYLLPDPFRTHILSFHYMLQQLTGLYDPFTIESPDVTNIDWTWIGLYERSLPWPWSSWYISWKLKSITLTCCVVQWQSLRASRGDAFIKFEPFVLHVQCTHLADAQLLVSTVTCTVNYGANYKWMLLVSNILFAFMNGITGSK